MEVVEFEFPAGSVPEGKSFRRLVDLFREYLPGTINRGSLEDSLRYLAGVPLTREKLYYACWRMAGNLMRLRQDKVVPPWYCQRFEEWVPVQITAAEPQASSSRHIPGALLTFRIWAGTPAGLTCSSWYTLFQCQLIASGLGYSRRPGPSAVNEPKYLYLDPEDLVNGRVFALLSPKLSDREPGIAKIRGDQSLRPWNREIIKRRCRTDQGYTCPREYPREFRCSRCSAGYESCLAATHRKEWVRQPCPSCKRQDAFFDPDRFADECVDCQRNSLWRRT